MRDAKRRLEPTRVLLDGVPLERCRRQEIPGGYDVHTPRGHRVLVATAPGARPEPPSPGRYDGVLLDLVGDPSHLGWLRHTGAVTEDTLVEAVQVDHRIASPAELERRMRHWRRTVRGPWRSLILGGARSGKSEEAERRVLANPLVTYVATGVMHADDPDWRARIAEHRARRPSWWDTAETIDLAGLLRKASGTLLIDGLGTWLTAMFDALGAWDYPRAVEPRIEELVDAWRRTGAYVVAVGDEVGLSIVPHTASGRAFRDALGRLNQRLAAESEDAALVVAGRVVELP
jgi:adenosylcobinamide kinase/adenosylcobinamide-phosphate guanylyltransferase